MNSIERLQAITQTIKECQEKAPLAASSVTLIAVSKTHPAKTIIPLIEAGHKVFGENRIQEAAEKWPMIREQYPDVKLHLIGTLQSNKAKEALALFDAIHTIDRPSLVDTLVKEIKNTPSVRCRDFFVQVNTGEEPRKGGASPQELQRLIQYIKETASGIFKVTGLMCVPPVNDNPAPHFALLHKLAQEWNLPNLSMGMSGDYETAIRFGATHIRIGTALFGERNT